MQLISIPNHVLIRKAKAMNRLERLKRYRRLRAAADAGATHYAFTVKFGGHFYGFMGPNGVWIENSRGVRLTDDCLGVGDQLHFEPIVLN